MLGKVVEYLAADIEAGRIEPTQTTEPARPIFRRRAMPEVVYKERGVYVVESEELERLVALADARDQRVVLQLWREMTKRGVARRLVDEGIEAGDTIRIGHVEVEWF